MLYITLKNALVKGSVDINDYVIDFSPDDHIVGLEILNLFNNLSNLPRDADIVNCQLDIRYNKNNTVIIAMVLLKSGQTIQANVPLLVPIPIRDR